MDVQELQKFTCPCCEAGKNSIDFYYSDEGLVSTIILQSGIAKQTMHCRSCGSTWRETYEITPVGFEYLNRAYDENARDAEMLNEDHEIYLKIKKGNLYVQGS